ncbi:MAG: hypothetical protein JNK85_13115 [Verrucomicrobiales bacterium]|nr:hypothetical protein [Verrucomicrobiales bacterium]
MIWKIRIVPIAVALWTTALALLSAPESRSATPPSLRVESRGTDLRLAWDPVNGVVTYTLERAEALVPATWQTITANLTATEWSGPLPTTGTGFYRLRVVELPTRGAVLTNLHLKTYSQADISALLLRYPVPGITARAVDAWKIVYQTLDAQGQPTYASALVVVPAATDRALPILSYQHGTITEREDVPSRLNDEADIGLLLAAAGYIAVLPDYLGLGDSPGFHPYHHAKSEATAVVDAVRGARNSLSARNVQWNNQLFLTGYSHGGHSTLAAHREFELLHTNEFTITASAPAAGAYDLSGTTTADLLSTRVPPNPYYTAYLLAAYVDVYGLAPDLASLLRAPYDTTLPPLLDGRHGGSEINAAMPSRPTDIFKPDYLQAFRDDPNHPLRVALRDNDLHTGWVPKSRTKLYHCRGDQDVVFGNSQVAFDTFKAAGAVSVELIDPFSLANHSTCALLALPQAKLWFDSLKQ